MKKILLPIAALGLALGVTGATAQAQATDFDSADQDDNGGVSWSEFILLFPDVSQEDFDLADLDRDGELSPSEYNEFNATASVGMTPLIPKAQPVPESLTYDPDAD